MDGHQRQREESRRMIEEALFALIAEKEFDRITVAELVRRADVARRTFYRLYDKKEDVLRGCFGRLCEEYQNMAPVLERYDLEKISEDFFGFWYAHRELLLLLHRCGLEELLYGEVGRASAEVVRKRIGGSVERGNQDIEYFACYSTGGFLHLLRRWVSEGMREPPQAYAKKVAAALGSFIRPASDLRF